MTRYARAKGSKASNERKEEEPTPWHVMRQQMVDQLSNDISQKNVNLLNDVKNVLNNKSDHNQEEIWTEFGEYKKNNICPKGNNTKNKNNVEGKTHRDKVKENKLKKSKVSYNSPESQHIIHRKQDMHLQSKSANTNVEIYETNESGVIECNSESIVKIGFNQKKTPSELLNGLKKRAKKLVTNQNIQCVNKSSGKCNSPIIDTDPKQKKLAKLSSTLEPRNQKIKKLGNINCELKVVKSDIINNEIVDTVNNKIGFIESHNDLETNPHKVSRKTKKTGSIKCETKSNIKKTQSNSNSKIEKTVKDFTPTNKSSNVELVKEHNTYKNNRMNNYSNWENYDKFHTIIANGREIKVVRFEGFYIKKDDAVELKKLRKKLRAQNISKEKIKAVMKLERRKAEKALMREKNNVCFHCRMFGHNFSDCPDIKDTELSKSGICFKCGSTEHSHFQCKVLKSQDFRYAVCFVCKEQGHIAKQCSLNPQGQYPKGGSCHLCGEVTHLRKDCPKAEGEKPSNAFTVEQMRNDQIEDINEVTSHEKKSDVKKPKVVMF